MSMVSNIKKGRKSVFREVGLVQDDLNDSHTTYTEQMLSHRAQPQRHRHHHHDHNSHSELGDSTDQFSESRRTTAEHDRADERRTSSSTSQDDEPKSPTSLMSKQSWYHKLSVRRPQVRSVATAPPAPLASMSTITLIGLLVAVVLPAFSYNNGNGKVEISGAAAVPVHADYQPVIGVRADSPTQICTRWSHQTGLINGTLYIYGGQAKTQGTQANNTWNNNFLTLDLTKSWDTATPLLKGLPQPSGPPAVANAYLWTDYNNLYLYGGQCADNPRATPAPLATWQYSIRDGRWIEFKEPRTSSGKNAAPGGLVVQRSSEGAGLSVPELGLSWYFGGHLDWATTPGWSWELTKRVYLKSLLEFTHPGYANPAVEGLVNKGAPDGGAYRNITEGGLQNSQGFEERADGVLVFVPGWGESGVLIGMGGGTEAAFSDDFSVLDVYDIKNSEWYQQPTKGEAPTVRVNPCAVIASAPDASSFQIYLWGGQNLQPFKEQIQYNDMYILSIPSFTWIKVVDQGANMPAPRAGHTCNMRDGQMVVVGGYVGNTIPCDSPGIHIFNATSLKWQSHFTALSTQPDLHPGNSVLANSLGYKVPDAVVRVIGGSPDGGATVSQPAAGPAANGPFATGKSPVFTITAGGGPAPTVTAYPNGNPTGPANNGDGSNNNNNPGLIVAAVLAGIAGVLALYLGYCAWLYRRQVRAYRAHLAVANQYGGAGASKASFGGLAAFFGRKGSKESRGSRGSRTARKLPTVVPGSLLEKGGAGGRRHGYNDSTSTTDSFAWVGREEPKAAWLSDEPTPLSGTGTSSSGHRASGAGGSPYGGYGRASDEQSLGPYVSPHGRVSGSGSGIGGSGSGAYGVMSGGAGMGRRGSVDSGGSSSSTEGLLDGQEPSFFSVVLGPRRALRVVNGLEDGDLPPPQRGPSVRHQSAP